MLYELKCRFGKKTDVWFHRSAICGAYKLILIHFIQGLETKNNDTVTPRSTTVTHTGNISMKDMSDKSLALLTASSTTLQIPKTG